MLETVLQPTQTKERKHGILSNVLPADNSLPNMISFISLHVFVKDCTFCLKRVSKWCTTSIYLSAENAQNSFFFNLFFSISNPVFQAPLIFLAAIINASKVFFSKICCTSRFCPSRALISNLLTPRTAKENENLCEKDKSIQNSYSYSAKHLICM